MIFTPPDFQTDSIAHDLEQFAFRIASARGGPYPSVQRQADGEEQGKKIEAKKRHGEEVIKQARTPSILFVPEFGSGRAYPAFPFFGKLDPNRILPSSQDQSADKRSSRLHPSSR